MKKHRSSIIKLAKKAGKISAAKEAIEGIILGAAEASQKCEAKCSECPSE